MLEFEANSANIAGMTLQEIMAELEGLGTQQARTTYGRHGAPQPLSGVSFADLGKLAKRIKRDQALADGLWATGNTDARTLATMIADPASFSVARLDAWLAGLAAQGLIDEVVIRLAAKSPAARAMMERGTASDDEIASLSGAYAP